MFWLVCFAEEQAEFDPQTVRPGSRYSHVQEVQERLNFLRCDTILCSSVTVARGADVECHVVLFCFPASSLSASDGDLPSPPPVCLRWPGSC